MKFIIFVSPRERHISCTLYAWYCKVAYATKIRILYNRNRNVRLYSTVFEAYFNLSVGCELVKH